jgi:tetratricopeptide (TPR) repeat protein/predicted Ser/Thr protein kinase
MTATDAPARVGSIRIDGVLGEGGMGTVYVGFDETLERKVALKSIRAERRLGAVARKRFLREARMLSRLEHPSICRIHGYVEQDGTDFLVLEYVEGATLARHITGGKLEARHRLDIAVQIADALAAAHAKGIVHRDLKPDNVMITPSGEVKVLDFGLARSEDSEADEPGAPGGASTTGDETGDSGSDPFAGVTTPQHSLATEVGHIVGTPLYMSPEQARGAAISTASDMYSYGLLIQSIWTEASPYPQELDKYAVVRLAAKAESLPADDVPKDIARIIDRLKTPAPASRATAVEVLERLQWIVDRPARNLRRAVGVVVLLLAVAAGVKYTVDLRHERGIAQRERGVADLRRGQAEDLLRFMSEDLRKKLRAVGRLDVLQDVDAKALAYYAAVPEAELTLGELTMRAQGLYQIGEVRIESGDLPGAKESFEASLEMSRRLVEKAPTDAEARKRLGYAFFWLGEVAYNERDLTGAQAHFESSRDVARGLVELEPENPEWRLELAAEESNIARMLQAQGDVDGALEILKQRLVTMTEIAALDPTNVDWQIELASSHLLLGTALEDSGDRQDAVAQYRANIDTLIVLVGNDPENATLMEHLATGHNYLGTAFDNMGLEAEALEQYEAIEEVTQALAKGDAANTSFQSNLATSLLNLGSNRVEDGKLESAEEPLRTALGLFDTLSARDPTRTYWTLKRANARLELGRLLERRKEFSQALDLARQVVALLAPFEGSSTDLAFITNAADARLLEGRLLAAQGLAPEARAAWERAHAILVPAAEGSRDASLLAPLARALLHLDRLDEARDIVGFVREQGMKNPLLEEAWAQALARAGVKES